MSTRPYFVHVRKQTEHGEISCKGGATIAIIGDPDNGFKAGVARCSLKDNYCKASGRVLSTGRAFEKTTQINLPDDLQTMLDAEAHVRKLFV